MSAVLAIDQSTSGSKALLFDLNGQLIDQSARPHRQIYPQPGWVEHDAEEIYQNVLVVISELLARQPDHACPLCLSLTNQRETVVVFERATGRPLYPALVWQCRRGAAICESLNQAGYSELVKQRTGLRLDPYFSASKLRWLLENKPQILKMLESGQALIGTIDTYLIYRLTGGMVFATDPTNACRTLLYDINLMRWDETLCALFGVPAGVLAEVRPCDAVFGTTTAEGRFAQPVPICGVMGDSQAALLAQRCYKPGMVKVTFGTGSSLLLNTGTDLRTPPEGIVSTVAWVLGNHPAYAFEGIINYSAATIAWLKDQAGMINSAAESESLAQSVPDNGGVYLVPAFVGLGAPHWAPEARAAIFGLTPSSTRAHIVRAGLESIAFQVKDALSWMVKEAGTLPGCIHADGGAVRNRFLMQFTADLTGYPLRVPDVPELSALGAVYAGFLGMGAAASLGELEQLPRSQIEYLPQMPAAQVEQLYQGWLAAVRRVL